MLPVILSRRTTPVLAAALLSACGVLPTQKPSPGHLQAEAVRANNANIPALVSATTSLQRPKPAAKVETYSVSVRNVPVEELLFALARDAKLNIDLHPGISGTVSINAIDQTLQQILTRLSKQVDMRWELNGPNLAIMPDSPFLRTYKIDYVNMARDLEINTEVKSQVNSAGGNSGGGTTKIKSNATNHFWATLDKNIQDILKETDKILPDGSSETVIERSDQQSTTGNAPATNAKTTAASGSAGPTSGGTTQQSGNTVVKRTTFREAASVISNPEAGVITVRASSRQHEKVQEFIDQVMNSARRQVMIEATIVEVELSNSYDQGINWQSLNSIRNATDPYRSGLSGALGATPTLTPGAAVTTAITRVATDTVGAAPNTVATTTTTNGSATTTQNFFPNFSNPGSIGNTIGNIFALNYVAPGLGISATVSLLENFGNVKVLSSPKISVLNNQAAIIKVTNNVVYFEVKADTTNTASGPSQTTVSTTAKSVDVGLVMSITPQVSDNNTVLLNVRPVISRLNGPGKADPNPNIPNGVQNLVPEISTREMESMLRLTDGETAVMGGLMSDTMTNSTDAVPGLSSLPGIGSLFTKRADVSKKTELVIFLKPTIIREPSIYGDYRGLSGQVPNDQFFANNPGPATRLLPSAGESKP